MLDWAVSAREINRPASGEDRQRDSGVAGEKEVVGERGSKEGGRGRRGGRWTLTDDA